MEQGWTTLERVKQVLSNLSGVAEDRIGDDMPLADHTDDGGLALDSLDRIEAAMRLEEEFGLEICDDDVDNPRMSTPAGIAAYLDSRLEVEQDGFTTEHPPIAA